MILYPGVLVSRETIQKYLLCHQSLHMSRNTACPIWNKKNALKCIKATSESKYIVK